MNPIYTICDKYESIAIIRGTNFKEDIIKNQEKYTAESTKDFYDITNSWFEIFQKGQLIGYFSKLEYASSFLKGEFHSDRVRE